MSNHASLRTKEQGHAEDYLRRAGYKVGGKTSDIAQDRKMVADAVHKHERHDHPGEPLTKLKGGGKVHGDGAKPRLDRFARGGKVGKGPAKINIVIATGGGEPERQMAFQQGAKVGAVMGGARPPMGAPPRPMPPPMPQPQSGMPAPGMAGAMAPATAGVPPLARPPMKRGGSVGINKMAGAVTAPGRLEKSGIAEDLVPVRGHVRRRAGGRV